MTNKNIILGGILIILIALAYLYQGPLKKWRAGLGRESNFLSEIDAKSIDKMEIIQDGKTTILEKQDDSWKVGGTKDFFVRKTEADYMISKLEEATKADLELVSTSKDKKSEFKTDNSGIEIKLYQTGNMIADFIVGKLAGDYQSTYISESGSDKTFSAPANLASAFNQTEWRDTTIFSSNKEKISQIRFQYPGREFSIEKKDNQWKGVAPYSYSLSEEKVGNVLDIMSNLTAIEIPEQNFAGTGLEKNFIIIQATGEGVDNIIMVGDTNKDGNYYAKRGDSDNIYLVTKNQRDELNKRIGELR